MISKSNESDATILMNNPKFLHLDYLSSVSTDVEFYKEILMVFQSESRSFVEKMQLELSRADFYSLCKTAHAMKPIGSYVGAHELSHLVQALENAARIGTQDRLTSLMNDIARIVEEVNGEINKYLSK